MPADFRVPRGWPTPTDKWIRDNAFWQPPPHWTPVENAVAAPADWRFWVPNKLWRQTTGAYFAPIAVWARLSNLAVLMWLGALVAGPFLGHPAPLRVIGFTAAAASVILLVVHETLKTRLSRRLLAQFAIMAQRGRQDRLTREYQRYLTAVA